MKLLLLLCWTATRAERAEQRGESFWRETCRDWSAEEVGGSPPAQHSLLLGVPQRGQSAARRAVLRG